MSQQIVVSPPCPWCGKEIDLSRCCSRRIVEHVLTYEHLRTKCKAKDKWYLIDKEGNLPAWRESLINDRGLPCPHCHQVMDTTNCETDPNVRDVANKHSDVCPSWPGYELHLGKPEAVKRWIEESKEIWREQSPNCKLLSDKELRARQVRAGKNQKISDKRKGGENGHAYDKIVAGEIGMHNRWHVRRGIKSPTCSLCV